MGWYLAAWFYFCGSLTTWWWVRAQKKPLGAQIFSVLFWPVIVPIVAVVY